MKDLKRPDVPGVLVASVSGGKDSTAMALALKRAGIPFVSIFADTGWEHNGTYDHLEEVEAQIGPVVRVHHLPELDDQLLEMATSVEAVMERDRPSAFVRHCLRKKLFPSRMIRWCTRELKIKPITKWLKENVDGPVLNTIGIRADESARRAKMPPIEKAPWNDNVTVWRPLLDWTLDDVIAEHHAAGMRPNPLYLDGAHRVGCWPCIMCRKSELAMVSKDKARVDAIRLLEGYITELRKETDDRPASLFLSPFRNRPRPYQIDEMISWATGRHQQEFPWPDDSGCMRWGLCEASRA